MMLVCQQISVRKKLTSTTTNKRLIHARKRIVWSIVDFKWKLSERFALKFELHFAPNKYWML